MNTIKAVQTPIFFLKPNRSMSYSSVIFFSFTLLNFLFYFMVFYVFLKSIFRKWTTKLSLAIFYKKKKACYNWNLRLLLLYMFLLHLTIWKYVNLLGRKLKRRYDFHNFNMDSCSTFFSMGHMLIRFV